MSFIEELKRRKVFRVAASYAVVAFIIMQLVEIVFPIFNFPQWTSQFVIILVLIGFPISVILSWVFDKTPQGYIKTESQKDLNKETDVKSKESKSFFKNKKNWLLVAGVISGVLIGRFGQTSSSSEDYINEKSIAVLPFDNLGNKQEDEYFADGMTEDILTELSKIKDLLVISRTTIMKYKDTNKSLKEIGKELGVANILEGSIRRIGDRVRITGQLINAINDKHLWAEKYDRNIEDIFEVQDEVATAIANALRIELSNEETQSIARKQTTSIEAYDLYIKGRASSYSYSLPEMYKAIKYYQAAINIDPNYALAYAGIARTKTSLSYFLYHDTELTNQLIYEAKLNAEKAIELGPNEAETHFAMGFYLRRDFKEAFPYFKKTITLNPSHAHAYDEIGDVYLDIYGNLDQALIWFGKALKRDPELPPAGWITIEIALKKGQVKKALVLADEYLIRHPKVVSYLTMKHGALMMAGRYKEAFNFIISQEDVYQDGDRMLEYYQALGYTLIAQKNFKELEKVLVLLKKTDHSEKTQHLMYLNNLKMYIEKDFTGAIEGFEMLNEANVIVQRADMRQVLKDICRYWIAISYFNLGEYGKTIEEVNQFRPTPNVSSVSFILDEFWPKKDYLKGLAYEKMGDERNARESFEEFIRIWSEADDDLPEIIDAKKRLRNLGWNS